MKHDAVVLFLVMVALASIFVECVRLAGPIFEELQR